MAVFIRESSCLNHSVLPVEAVHFPNSIAKSVPVCLRQIVDLVDVPIHAAGRDFVQQRFPQMRATSVNKRDRGFVSLAEPIAEHCCKLKPACSAANNHDAVQLRVRRFCVFDHPQIESI
jgi:hypothetical protein